VCDLGAARGPVRGPNQLEQSGIFQRPTRADELDDPLSIFQRIGPS
jgi:hypothetical protein